MIASLSIPRSARHPAWFLPVLLPMLPFLGWIFGARGSLAPAQIGAGLLLLALGLALATALPSLLEFLGPEYRNEAEHLRDSWLAATFLAQIPLFVSGAEWTFPSLAFATTP